MQIRLVPFALVLAAMLALASSAHAAFPGANGKIAFRKAGNVYTVNPDGTGLMPLTADGLSSQPAWSPDGGKIAFTTHRDDPTCTYPCNEEI